MKPRKTLREMGMQPGPPLAIAGKPADSCPYCGCVLFTNGTRHGESVTFRYLVCRNPSCGRSFQSKQPPATLIREIGVDD